MSDTPGIILLGQHSAGESYAGSLESCLAQKDLKDSKGNYSRPLGYVRHPWNNFAGSAQCWGILYGKPGKFSGTKRSKGFYKILKDPT